MCESPKSDQRVHLLTSQSLCVVGNSKRKDGTVMNNYEMPEAIELGQAKALILGMKVIDPEGFDTEMGIGWRTLTSDIDESDE